MMLKKACITCFIILLFSILLLIIFVFCDQPYLKFKHYGVLQLDDITDKHMQDLLKSHLQSDYFDFYFEKDIGKFLKNVPKLPSKKYSYVVTTRTVKESSLMTKGTYGYYFTIKPEKNDGNLHIYFFKNKDVNTNYFP